MPIICKKNNWKIRLKKLFTKELEGILDYHIKFYQPKYVTLLFSYLYHTFELLLIYLKINKLAY